MLTEFDGDVVIVGGGIAGVSIGYELAGDFRVGLLDMEGTLAYHTTGRSAATSLETYGNQTIRALTGASRALLTHPTEVFGGSLAAPLPLLYIAGRDRGEGIDRLQAEVSVLTPSVRRLSGAEAAAMNPVLRPGFVEAALVEPGALEVDVHALHQGYTRGLRARGGQVFTTSRVVAAEPDQGSWTVRDAAGRCFRAPVVIDAAGAWSDEVGALLGAAPVGIRALRRSVFMVGCDRARSVPMTIEVDDRFYLKPEGVQLLCSPADATPQPPGDARPDELEIARAIEAINEATTLDVRHVRSSWAGLRSFVADDTPVVGFDPTVPGLFWYAGQGGYGIQIAPALARTAATMIRGQAIPEDVLGRGLDPTALDPRRFGPADID